MTTPKSLANDPATDVSSPPSEALGGVRMMGMA